MHHIERSEKSKDESYWLSKANYAEYSYSELQDATNNFHESFIIGEGGFGIVYKGILNKTESVAIKVLKQGSSQGAKDFNEEVEVLSNLRHPNLVELIGACTETRALIYEYLPNGSLEDRLRCKNNTLPLSWQARVCIASEICSALIFLHSSGPQGILHCDLKPDNILLDENDTSKICDIGLCRELYYTANASMPYHWKDCPKGTFGYMDPEYFSTGKLTPQYDVYSFGILLLRLATCKNPLGIRQLVEEAHNKGTLKALIDASAGTCSFREAEKMISLGLKCSDPKRRNRPDLSTEVLNEIKSMLEVANYCGEYSYSELQDATNNFDESLILGEGGFGIVYQGILQNTYVAIKIPKDHVESSQGEKEFYHEVEVLSKLRHPNLVQLVGACAKNRALIFEYLPNGSLEDCLRCKNNTQPLSWKARVRIAFDICSVLSFLHCTKPHGIVHGDLKPDNILLDENDRCKICDFGLCREVNNTASTSIPYHKTDFPKGTLVYMDPVYFSTGKITPQCDVYSFGIMLLRLATCKNPQGIRPLVEEAQNKGTLEALIDSSAGPWSFREAEKLISLGLRCSNPIRKNRPALSTEVLKEITSLLHVENYLSEYSYTYSELQDATNNFHESFKLGEGWFGIVYKGILQNTVVAIMVPKEGSNQGAKEFYDEVEALSKLQHPNLVKFIGACAVNCALIYEYLPNGTLEDHLQCKNNTLPLSFHARVRIAFEICSAVSFLHHTKPIGIVHGDLKPNNILLDENNISKVCDFGLCRELKWTASASLQYLWMENLKGTFAYMDPEYFSIGKITPQYDVYSFGILLLRLATGKDPCCIRQLAEEAQKKGTLKALIDASAGPGSYKVATKMISLGLKCSDPMQNNRPDLSTEVLKEIMSVQLVANHLVDYSYSELQVATNNFDESFKLAESWFGILYKGILHNTTVTIKMPKEERNQGVKVFHHEIEILSNLQHPNLVKLLGACAETGAVIYEYLPNGSLEDRLRCKSNTSPLSWQVRIHIAFEICSALSFLHCNKPHCIVHGDLQPNNILLDLNNVSKISNFGLSRELDLTGNTPYHSTDCIKGTIGYMDPHYFQTLILTPQGDVYSFGILLLQLATCKNPRGIRQSVEEAQKKGTLKALIDASAGPWPFMEAEKMISLGLRCTDLELHNRPDLSNEVWKEMKSMAEVASASLVMDGQVP